MTKDIKYMCNFCHNTHFDNAGIVGVQWDSGTKLYIVDKSLANNHLCATCIKAIAGLWKEDK